MNRPFQIGDRVRIARPELDKVSGASILQSNGIDITDIFIVSQVLTDYLRIHCVFPCNGMSTEMSLNIECFDLAEPEKPKIDWSSLNKEFSS